MNPTLLKIIVITIGIKVILLFAVNDSLNMNPDEDRNYQIAFNHYNGNGYTIYDAPSNTYSLTSFHASFPVFIYETLIQYQIKKEVWILFVLIVTQLLFACSIYYFYKLCSCFFTTEKYSLYATVTYCLYPSVLFYIGSLILYENFVLSLLVINAYRLVSAIHKGFTRSDYFTMPVSISMSCLFRPNILAVYAVLFLIFIILVSTNKKWRLLPLTSVTIIFTFLMHLPVLSKNKQMFGSYILSTEAGFAFLLGHNPTARGGWAGDYMEPSSEHHRYVLSKIKNFDLLNEYEKSTQSMKLGINWIISQPISDAKLELKKLAIYFLPQNFNGLKTWDWYNPLNMIIHFFFLCMIGIKIIKSGFTFNDWMILAPIIASIAICLIFFSGYRWRYYAEPFMIIFAWQFIQYLITCKRIMIGKPH